MHAGRKGTRSGWMDLGGLCTAGVDQDFWMNVRVIGPCFINALANCRSCQHVLLHACGLSALLFGLWQIDSGQQLEGESVRVVGIVIFKSRCENRANICSETSLPRLNSAMASWLRSFCSRLHTNTIWRNQGNVNLDSNLPTVARSPAGCLTPKECPEGTLYITWLSSWQCSFGLRNLFLLHYCCLVTVSMW